MIFLRVFLIILVRKFSSFPDLSLINHKQSSQTRAFGVNATVNERANAEFKYDVTRHARSYSRLRPDTRTRHSPLWSRKVTNVIA